jgi:hypothetical protein
VEICNNPATTSADIYLENTDGYYNFKLNNQNFDIFEGATSRLRIASGGNVGIGTTSPAALLTTQAAASVAWNTSALFTGGANGDNAGSVVYIRPVGNSYGGAIYGGRWSSTNRGIRVVGINQGGQERSYVHVNGEGDTVEFATATAERARIDSSGRLLIGTSTALTVDGNVGYQPFQVAGIGASVSRFSADAAGPALTLSKSRSATTGNNTIVQSNDFIGAIGFRAADGSSYVAAASITCEVDGTPGANDMPARIVLSTTADGASSPAERMRIRNNGAVRIFATTNAPSATQAGIELLGNSSGTTAFSAGVTTTSFNQILFYNGNGIVGSIVTSGSATAYNTSSDYRLKENVTAVTDGITRLQQLKPSRFNFIADPAKTVDGFLAHEAQAVVPECVTGTKDAVDDEGNPEYQGIDQSKLVPLLTAALQEAIAKIESLEARLTAAGI